MSFLTDVEVRTKSVPTAGHLLVLGFEPLGVIVREGTRIVRFSSTAREALATYIAAKSKIDALLDGAEPAR